MDRTGLLIREFRSVNNPLRGSSILAWSFCTKEKKVGSSVFAFVWSFSSTKSKGLSLLSIMLFNSDGDVPWSVSSASDSVFVLLDFVEIPSTDFSLRRGFSRNLQRRWCLIRLSLRRCSPLDQSMQPPWRFVFFYILDHIDLNSFDKNRKILCRCRDLSVFMSSLCLSY